MDSALALLADLVNLFFFRFFVIYVYYFTDSHAKWFCLCSYYIGSPHGNLPIYVKTVFSRGAAVTSGLKRGDQIIAVNSIPCEGLTHHEAVGLLKNAKADVNLTILS